MKQIQPPAGALPGHHLLLDFYGADHLDNPEIIQQALMAAAKACEATVLNINLHHFGPNQGVTGVAQLAESHISLHSWPEHGYVALDIFVCGKCDPTNAIEPLKSFFNPDNMQLTKIQRGLGENCSLSPVTL